MGLMGYVGSSMSKAKIEKNVPLPTVRLVLADYPWQEMKVGESFVVQNAKRKAVYKMTLRAKEKHGGSYVVREVKDDVRVWKV